MPYIGNPAVVGDSTNTFKLLDDIQSFTLTFDATDTSVVSISADTLTFRNHRFLTGQRVTYNDGGGTAIGGLADGVYFIIKVDQNTIKLASSASNAASSTAINLTSGAAGGSHTLNVAFDSVNTKFSATHSSGTKAGVSRAGQISLSINGVIQQPQDTGSPTVGYGVLPGSIIIFSTAPAATDKVFGTFIGEVAASFDLTDNTVDNFTGDGSTTSFNLSRDVPSSNDVLVTLDGVTQYPTDSSATRSYAVIESTLTFVSAPDTGVAIQVRHIGFAGATTSAVTGFYGRQGNVALVNTDDISVQNISAGIGTFNTIAVGGTVSIGGTLTYEDVTNIDSVGLVTARNGIVVGSGITLSKDGDGFFTGVVTATSYAGSGANLTGIDTDLVSDTSPQLGGNLDVNTKNIVFGDSGGATDDRLTFGAGTDLSIYHDGSHSRMVDSGTGNLILQTNKININNADGTEAIIHGTANGAVELYYDNTVHLATDANGIHVTTNVHMNDNGVLELGTGSDLQLFHNGSSSVIKDNGSGALTIQNANSEVNIYNTTDSEYLFKATNGGSVELYNDGTKMAETFGSGLKVSRGGELYIDGNAASGHCQLIMTRSDMSYMISNETFLRIYRASGNSGSPNTLTAEFTNSGHFRPGADNTYDLGDSSTRWRNLYTTDLQLSNEGKSNSVDGTWGNYTIQEGESDLFLINNRSGKKYKFNLTEVL